ncbi:DUF480 domain-containing protein, partial [Mesorhizobium sp. M8A.F.Ca.ET.213.01.1.1]
PSVDELRGNLDLLIGRKPPLVQQIDRGPGQREDRYAHLLCGPVQMPLAAAPLQSPSPATDLEARVQALEEEVERLRARIDALAGEGR